MRKILSLVFVLSCLLMLFVATAVEAGTPCVGSPNTRLQGQTQGHIAQRFSSLRSSIAGPVTRVMYAPATFTIVSGPHCSFGGVTYYEIDYGGGLRGFAAEGENYSVYGVNQYWLAPGAQATATVTPTIVPSATPGGTPGVCAGSLVPRLAQGGTGRIAQRFSSLRAAPAGEVIRVVYAPATFTVRNTAPVCAGGVLFWNIDYGNGLTGWAAESEVYSIYGFNQYWLAPA
jgi:hypothetical protein